MTASRDILIHYLKNFIDSREIKRVIIAEKFPEVPEPRDILPLPRIIIVMSGMKEIYYTSNQQIEKNTLIPGDVLFIPPLCCSRTCWTTPHEMMSILLRKDLLRVLYINNPGQQLLDTRPDPNIFFHVRHYQQATKHVFQALSALKNPDSECPLKLVECLLRLTLEDLEQSSDLEKKFRLSCASWSQIIEYVHHHITEDITREHVAKQFSLTPQYISRLFKNNTGMTFKTYLTSERMRQAAELLRKTNFTIDEIAWECGYPFSSYFIKVFRKHYDVSPGTFRRTAIKETTRLQSSQPSAITTRKK